jgi:copper(I)-binding protein
MMIMRATDTLPLVAKQEYEIGAGNHIMLVGLKRPLKAGETVTLKLTVELAGKKTETVLVKAEVRPLGAVHEHDMGHMHHHHD